MDDELTWVRRWALPFLEGRHVLELVEGSAVDDTCALFEGAASCHAATLDAGLRLAAPIDRIFTGARLSNSELLRIAAWLPDDGVLIAAPHNRRGLHEKAGRWYAEHFTDVLVFGLFSPARDATARWASFFDRVIDGSTSEPISCSPSARWLIDAEHLRAAQRLVIVAGWPRGRPMVIR